jgi:hypothetical protein
LLFVIGLAVLVVNAMHHTTFVVPKIVIEDEAPSPPRSRRRTDDIMICKLWQPLPPHGHTRFRRPKEPVLSL